MLLTIVTAYFIIGLVVALMSLTVVLREERRSADHQDWVALVIVSFLWPRFIWKLITNNPTW